MGSRTAKVGIVAVLAAVVIAVIAVKQRTRPPATNGATQPKAGIPRLVDLGAGKCIPCKMMAPILEELKKEYAGRLQVDVIDLNDDPAAAEKLNVAIIPTQIFYDADGKELWRHEGFISKADILAKWKEFGVDLAPQAPGLSREEPLAKDERPRDRVCAMCGRDVSAKARVTVKTAGGDVVLCGPHCFFIYYSSLRDTTGVDEKVSVTDSATGQPVPATAATFLYGVDGLGRPTIKTFAEKDAALEDQKTSGGNLLDWAALRTKELAVRCAFCDRANYPEDACPVKAGGVSLHACCPMCALGVAARRQENIETVAKDPLAGEPVRVSTMDGSVGAVDPPAAVAWHGQKRGPDGKMASAGCFKQFFFASEANLRQWLDKHPEATGKMLTLHQALAAKMKMTPDQIKNACKIGECPPAK